MPGNPRKPLDLVSPLGRDPLPHADRALREPKPRRQPSDQAALAADEIHPVHGHDLSAGQISPQANNIGQTNMANPPNDPPDPPNPPNLGAILRKARLDLNLRQSDLAKMIGVKQSSISQWESGKFTPELDSRIMLASALHISLHDLMPEGPAISEEALKDPQIRRIVDNCLQLDPGDRQAVELISLRLRESKALRRP